MIKRGLLIVSWYWCDRVLDGAVIRMATVRYIQEL